MTVNIANEKILDIKPYKGGLSKIAGQDDVIKLSSNETPYGPSPKAIEAYKNAANNLNIYPDGAAYELRQAIGQVYDLDPEQIICGAGSDEIISLICQAFASTGDEVIYTEHGFLMYPISTLKVGATPVKVKEKNLTTDIDAILEAVNDKTKIVFIANPNNPTGTYISDSQLLKLRENLPDHILLVIDGAYTEYVEEDDYSCGKNIVDLGENTIMTRTFSKIYGLASLRLGWAYCPKTIIDILNRVRGPFNVSTPAIEAGIAAISDIEFTTQTRNKNNRELSYLTQEINKIDNLEILPSVANFVLIKFKDDITAQNTNKILMDNSIIVRDVTNYGLSNYLRITIGTNEQNIKIINILKSV